MSNIERVDYIYPKNMKQTAILIKLVFVLTVILTCFEITRAQSPNEIQTRRTANCAMSGQLNSGLFRRANNRRQLSRLSGITNLPKSLSK